MTIPNNDPSPLVEVTQADRVAASDAYHGLRPAALPSAIWMAQMENGEHDDDALVRSFAKHRLGALRTPMPARVEPAIPADERERLEAGLRQAAADMQLTPRHNRDGAADRHIQESRDRIRTVLLLAASSTDAPARVGEGELYTAIYSAVCKGTHGSCGTDGAHKVTKAVLAIPAITAAIATTPTNTTRAESEGEA